MKEGSGCAVVSDVTIYKYWANGEGRRSELIVMKIQLLSSIADKTWFGTYVQ